MLFVVFKFLYVFVTSHKETLREQFLAVSHAHEGADAEAVEVFVEGLPHLCEGSQCLDRLAGLVSLALLPSPGDSEQLVEGKVGQWLCNGGAWPAAIGHCLLIFPD